MRILPHSPRHPARPAFGPADPPFSFQDLLVLLENLHQGELRSLPALPPPLAAPASGPRIQATTWSIQVVQIQVSSVQTGGGAESPSRPQDPLLVDLDGTGPATTGLASPRIFDLQGNGQARPTSFATGSSAFLALDRDGNGRIDSGKELFGDQHGASDGFEELRRFDVDHNGRIDARDPVFGSLQLLHGDGHVEPLQSRGLVSFELGAIATRIHQTRGGDPVFRQAVATTLTGQRLSTYAVGLRQG